MSSEYLLANFVSKLTLTSGNGHRKWYSHTQCLYFVFSLLSTVEGERIVTTAVPHGSHLKYNKHIQIQNIYVFQSNFAFDINKHEVLNSLTQANSFSDLHVYT